MIEDLDKKLDQLKCNKDDIVIKTLKQLILEGFINAQEIA